MYEPLAHNAVPSDEELNTGPPPVPSASLTTPLRSANSRHNEELPDTSYFGLYRRNLRRTVLTAGTYDFSMGLIALIFLLTLWGYEKSAPAITTTLSFANFLIFATVFAASHILSTGYGQINGNKALIKKEKKDSKDPEKNTYENPADLIKKNHDAYKKIIILRNQMGRIPRNVSIVGLGAGAIAIIPMLSINKFLSALGQEAEVSDPAQIFFYSYLIFFILSLPRLPLEFAHLAFEKQFITAPIALCVLVSTIGLEVGLNQVLGLTGASVAAGIGAVATMLAFAAYLALGADYKAYQFIKSFFSRNNKNDTKQMRYFICEAIPTLLASGTDNLMPFITAMIAGKLKDESALIRQNAAMSVLFGQLWIGAAASQTTQLEVSRLRGIIKETGAFPYKILYRPLLMGLAANVSLQSLFIIPISCAPAGFIKVLGSSADATNILPLLLLTILNNLIVNSSYIILLSNRALGNNNWPSFVTSLCMWLGAFTMFIASIATDLKVEDLPIIMAVFAALGVGYLTFKLPATIGHAEEVDQDEEEETPKGILDENEDVQVDDDKIKEVDEEIENEMAPVVSYGCWPRFLRSSREEYVEIAELETVTATRKKLSMNSSSE